MMFEHRATGPYDIQKSDFASQEPGHGRFIGRVERGTGGTAAAHDFKSKVQAQERFPVGRFKVQRKRYVSDRAGGMGSKLSRGRSVHTGWAIACRAERAAQ